MEVRKRNVSSANKKEVASSFVKDFDIFQKLPKECKKSTKSGGLTTIVTAICILICLLTEITNYLYPAIEYVYEIDSDITNSIKVNVDMTVATPCSIISLDAVDSTGISLLEQQSLVYNDVNFELNLDERESFELYRRQVRSVQQFHHYIHDVLWKEPIRFEQFTTAHPPTTSDSSLIPKNDKNGGACHINGSMQIKKVYGNIHIMYGVPLNLFDNAHVHIAPLFSSNVYNFSHRIYQFSFGELTKNQIHPLQAIESITSDAMMSYKYFITMVPTQIIYPFSSSYTYQYALSVQNRTINHSAGSHGLPGIFFNYDTFPLVVKVVQNRELFGTFLARLAAIVGGIFSTVGLLRLWLYALPDLLFQFRFGKAGFQLFSKWKLTNAHTVPILDPDSDT